MKNALLLFVTALVVIQCVSGGDDNSAESAKKKKKKDIRDYTDAEMEELFAQWEVEIYHVVRSYSLPRKSLLA